MRKALITVVGNYGHPQTPATRKKISKAHKRQALNGMTPETNKEIRKKISQTMKLLRSKIKKYWISCRSCGMVFRIQKYQLGKAKYCCRDCAHIGKRKNRRKKRCFSCKELFSPVDRRAKFCSRRCWKNHYSGVGSRGGQGVMFVKCSICTKRFKIMKWLYEYRMRHNGRMFCSRSCAFAAQLYQIKPNGLEKKLIPILRNFGFKYVGNGKLKVGTKFPDFVHVNKPLLVELFGEYWHKRSEALPRAAYFRRYGFDCLVIWGNELKHKRRLKARIKKFMLVRRKNARPNHGMQGSRRSLSSSVS